MGEYLLKEVLSLRHTPRLGVIPAEEKKKQKRTVQRINKNNEEKTAPTEVNIFATHQ